jgi:hypothetical protein
MVVEQGFSNEDDSDSQGLIVVVDCNEVLSGNTELRVTLPTFLSLPHLSTSSPTEKQLKSVKYRNIARQLLCHEHMEV